MKKIFLKFAFFCTLVFFMVWLMGCSGSGKDFTLQRKEYESTVTELKLELGVSDVEVRKSDKEKIIFEYFDKAEPIYSIKEENGTVTMSDINTGASSKIKFGMGKYYKTIISVPNGYQGDLILKTVLGDILVKNFSSKENNLNIKNENGEIKLDGVAVTNLNIESKASDITIKNINVSNVDIVTVDGEIKTSNIQCAKYSVNGETTDVEIKNVSVGGVSVAITAGDVYFENVKAGGTVKISSRSGDIHAEGLDASICSMTSGSGDIELENLWIGSSIYLVSESGDIEASVADPATNFKIDAISDYGKNNLKNLTGFGFKNFTVRNVTGDINIKFSKY